MSKRNFCQACSNEKFGVKSRIAVEHTCGQETQMNPNWKTYKDTIHGFTAKGLSRQTAWGLIRNKCHELKLQVPMLNEIVEVD